MKLFLIISIYLICACDGTSTYESFTSNRCRSADQDFGLCVPLKNCPYLANLDIQHGKNADVIAFKKLSHLSCGNRTVQDDMLFCCSRPVGIALSSTISKDPIPVRNRFSNNQSDGNETTEADQALTKNPITSTTNTPNKVLQSTTVSTVPFPVTVPTQSTPLLMEMSPATSTPLLKPKVESDKTIPTHEIECLSSEGFSGYCISLLLCPPLYSRLVANPKDEKFKELLRSSNKRCDALPPIVCCPNDDKERPEPQPSPVTTNTETRLSSPLSTTTATKSSAQASTKPRLLSPGEGCGRFKIEAKGTLPPAHGTWPWLALLGYKVGTDLSFECGGSLITSRHVLTAAHCIKNNLHIVRLGEYDLSKSVETEHFDIEIARISKHPEYDGNKNDISVLHLSKIIEFSDKIKPACIPDRIKYEGISLVGLHPFVAGWRKSSGLQADVVQEMQLTIYENDQCNSRFLVPRPNLLDEKVICAGELSISANDRCYGDSGGPLMAPDALDKDNIFFDVIGIESYVRKCHDERAPGVYTNVLYYSNWIREKVMEAI